MIFELSFKSNTYTTNPFKTMPKFKEFLSFRILKFTLAWSFHHNIYWLTATNTQVFGVTKEFSRQLWTLENILVMQKCYTPTNWWAFYSGESQSTYGTSLKSLVSYGAHLLETNEPNTLNIPYKNENKTNFSMEYSACLVVSVPIYVHC